MRDRLILQSIVEDLNFEDLPRNWSTIDVVSFSKKKKLWNFQQDALKNAIKTLYLYFKQDGGDKRKFYERYKANGLDEDLEKELDMSVLKTKKVSSILREYYPVEDNKIKFYNFINRAAFWMATGSGKTLIIVKLVEALKRLMDLGEIPKKDILILTHRDDLIGQIKKHVNEFNELFMKRHFKIDLVELTKYEEIKRESLIPFFDEITVFYYRSDLINDEQKEKIIDFRNYENDGNWYIILDEAHKGDKEESKRQMFYSIMSRNGFLFNFSATFTDPRDIVTTAYNFNLERFISEGYGKHIYILKQEMRAFREGEDYNKDEKQKIVLKSLILLTYLKKIRERIKEVAGNIYHEPLMLALVNTVNLSRVKGREKPDLTLFFEEIKRIGRGDVDEKIFEEAKEELLQEFLKNPNVMYEGLPIKASWKEIMGLRIEDVLKYVYNSPSFGEVEAVLIPGRRKEALLKLKASHSPFALIKIGDAIKWIKENLKGYEVIESYEDKSIFENLDEREDISILMGSRAFYEGWDSNRPNVILFINIGVGTEAKKFVIQSVGRGVRIEPIKGKRRRLRNLYNKGEDEGLYSKIGGMVDPIETLFIFGTNRNALSEVMETLRRGWKLSETIELMKNEKADLCELLIPVFKLSSRKIYQERTPQKFVISEELFNLLKKYFTTTDERVLIVQNDLSPELLSHLKKSFDDDNSNRYYKISSKSPKIPLKLAVKNLIAHFNLCVEELDEFKRLEDEIIHFKRVKVFLKEEEKEEFEKLKEKIANVLKSSKEEEFRDLKIKIVPNHYYFPLILSKKEKVEYIKHIIKTKSEVKFVEDLENYLKNNGNRMDVDWWMFSKIDEHLDEIYIPYYDPDNNKMRRFKPDFIFWLKKGKNYFIVFVDPKGIKHTEFEHKVDWFKRLFGDISSPKVFNFNGLEIRVFLYLYTEDKNKLPEGYEKYWFDSVEKIFEVTNSVKRVGGQEARIPRDN